MATGDVLHEAASFFDFGGGSDDALVSLQVEATAPSVTGLETATGMLLGDIPISQRLAHFPDDLYDMRETSHLVRFLTALLGDAGAGSLRKQSQVSLFRSVMRGTHFYDLDRFYGSIFGISRKVGEILGIDPTTDPATSNEWDQIAVADSSFRDRISHLASAINMGGTYPGIKAAAEAITQVECDIYEVWDLLDTYGPGGAGRSWDDIEAIGTPGPSDPTWDAVEALDSSVFHLTWQELEASVILGRTGTNSRAEVIVVPKKNYDAIVTDQGEAEAQRVRLEDEHSLIRVLNVLKPASTLLTVNTEGIAVHIDTPMADLQADSNYWAVITRVAPNPALLAPDGLPYPLSLQQTLNGLLQSDLRQIPKPPWSEQQAARWSHAPEVVSAQAYAFDNAGRDEPGNGDIIDSTDSSVITYMDGTRETFGPDRGPLDPRRALAARYAAQGILISAPYMNQVG